MDSVTIAERSGRPTIDKVEARGLTKVYGRQRALAGVDLTLRAGEAVALLGPNGAGKSTLVGILSTLLPPSGGEVRYGGRPAHDDDELRGAIGVIAHESLCYGDLTGRENLVFFARLYGVADPAGRADELLRRVGLAGDAERRPARTYSRGMVQRLAVARALVHRPQLLLCDEPFTGLDRAGVELLGALLAEERGRGTILVVVTHDFDAVATLIDRVVVIARGKITRDEPAPRARTTAALADLYRAAVQS
jgi:heme exporter protein A